MRAVLRAPRRLFAEHSSRRAVAAHGTSRRLGLVCPEAEMLTRMLQLLAQLLTSYVIEPDPRSRRALVVPRERRIPVPPPETGCHQTSSSGFNWSPSNAPSGAALTRPRAAGCDPLEPGTANLPWAQEVQGLLACDLTPSARQELWHSFTTSVGIPQNTAADRERARALYVPFRVLVGRTLAAAAALERSLDRDSVERRRAGRAGFRPRTRHLPRGPRLGAEAVPPLPLGGPGGGGAAARVNPALDPPRLPGPPGGRDPRVSDADRATPPSETAPGHPLPRSPSEVRALTLDCILIRRIRFHSIRSSVVAHTGPQGYPCRRGRQRPASRRQHRRSR
jgi:hypothetical protein